MLLCNLLAKNSDNNHRKLKRCPERHAQHVEIAGGLASALLLSSLRSDPVTCARSQRGLGLRLDLPGQPLRGQH